MVPQTLLKLMVQVLVTVVRPPPSSPYRVDHLRVDFDCGSLGATMSSICREFKEPSGNRLVRSVSGEYPSISVQSHDPSQDPSHNPSQNPIQNPSQNLSQNPSQNPGKVPIQNPMRETGMPQQQYSHWRLQLPTTTIVPPAAGVGVVLTREAAHTFVRTQGRRRRNSFTTSQGHNSNAQDECCSQSKPKFCVFEEIAEYCSELHEGVWIP